MSLKLRRQYGCRLFWCKVARCSQPRRLSCMYYMSRIDYLVATRWGRQLSGYRHSRYRRSLLLRRRFTVFLYILFFFCIKCNNNHASVLFIELMQQMWYGCHVTAADKETYSRMSYNAVFRNSCPLPLSLLLPLPLLPQLLLLPPLLLLLLLLLLLPLLLPSADSVTDSLSSLHDRRTHRVSYRCSSVSIRERLAVLRFVSRRVVSRRVASYRVVSRRVESRRVASRVHAHVVAESNHKDSGFAAV